MIWVDALSIIERGPAFRESENPTVHPAAGSADGAVFAHTALRQCSGGAERMLSKHFQSASDAF